MALSLSVADQEQIGAWLRAPSTPQQVVLRCRIVLGAARALTMLVAAHSAMRAPPPAPRGGSGMFLAALMLDAASGSNFATFSGSQGEENLEWNKWTHLTHCVSALPGAEGPPRRQAWNPAPTNR
jgi:hypothetical protein